MLGARLPLLVFCIACSSAPVDEPRLDGAVRDATRSPDATDPRDAETDARVVTLPIEILGEPGTIERVMLDVARPTDAAYLWLQTHRLTWREDGEHATLEAPRNAVRPGTKGSVRLNGGPWVGLSNETVSCESHEAEYGCLNGGYMTVRLRVDLARLGAPGLREVDNELELRFDETDGITSGWRVLALDFRDAGGASLSTTTFVEDDPDTWVAPLTGAEDIARGRELFVSAPLTDLGFENERHAIRGTCASCHFEDGYDLAYFNYSNRSIIARSQFHGLSELESMQIASYVRSIDLELPAGRRRSEAGRPWNPPYQPGPGLDSRPVELWAAGAGLDAVLERDSEMRPYFFPEGRIDPRIVGSEGHLNPRETPQALQYPDWNAWLPTIAVEDLVEDPALIPTSAPYERLAEARSLLATHRRTDFDTAPQARARVFFAIRRFAESRSIGFPGSYHYTDRDVPTPTRTHELMVKQTRHNLAYVSWFNLRQFELFHRFGLEDQTHVSPASGAPRVPIGDRSWGSTFRTVFETAPHFVADGAGLSFNFTQPGNYLSTAWYSLEQIINGGFNAASFGIDWNYHPGHIWNTRQSAVGFYLDGPIPAYRLAWALIWFYQAVPTEDWRTEPPTPFTPRSFGFYQRQFIIGLGVQEGARLLEERGEITREDRAMLQEALTLAFLGVAERYTPDQWVRRTVDDEAHRTADNFETIDYVPRVRTDLPEGYAEWGYQADAYYARIHELSESGLVTPATIHRLCDWGAGVWPRGDWDALRPR
jgi:hypothetical protein